MTLTEAIRDMPDADHAALQADVARALKAQGVGELTEANASIYLRTLEFLAKKYKLKWSN